MKDAGLRAIRVMDLQPVPAVGLRTFGNSRPQLSVRFLPNVIDRRYPARSGVTCVVIVCRE